MLQSSIPSGCCRALTLATLIALGCTPKAAPAGTGTTGHACTTNNDCASGFCEPVTAGKSVCANRCQATTDCVAGWTCSDLIGQSQKTCICLSLPESCNGKDDDCDGVVDNDASTACAAVLGAGGSCLAGQCSCGEGKRSCAGTCVDVSTDLDNCGQCGQRCHGEEVCTSGNCQCPSDRAVCGDLCVDARTDAFFCGSCTNECSTGATCGDGACHCGAGQYDCHGACVARSTSNCGGCDLACVAGASCESIGCACPSGQTMCSTECSALNEISHCGSCDNACETDYPSVTCEARGCVKFGLVPVPTSGAPGAQVAAATTRWPVFPGGPTDFVSMDLVYVSDETVLTCTGASDAAPPAGVISIGGTLAIDDQKTFVIGKDQDGHPTVVQSSFGGTAVTLARNVPPGTTAAVGNGVLYWAKNAVYSLPTSGGDVATLTTDTMEAARLVVSGSNLYWSDLSAGALVTMPVSGGARTTLVTEPTLGADIGIANGGLYFTTSAGLLKKPLAGGNTATVRQGLRHPFTLNGSVAWGQDAANNILRIPLDGSAVVTLRRQELTVTTFAAGGQDTLYWYGSDEHGAWSIHALAPY